MSWSQEAPIPEVPSTQFTQERIRTKIGTGRALYVVTDEKNGTVCYIVGGHNSQDPLAISCVKK